MAVVAVKGAKETVSICGASYCWRRVEVDCSRVGRMCSLAVAVLRSRLVVHSYLGSPSKAWTPVTSCPPLSATGALSCHRSLINSELWRFLAVFGDDSRLWFFIQIL
ncbi:hypothetical protein M9H77_28015 [Catharanthus roseus]|uniref:Uncharacterized protein n=1 Tax=Catharanthus roseus TaxID=4058 RepID=A0ACC0AGU1_CATRO|nr:hypothetical protein M9H77_28015 [Catharanthus roseus]